MSHRALGPTPARRSGAVLSALLSLLALSSLSSRASRASRAAAEVAGIAKGQLSLEEALRQARELQPQLRQAHAQSEAAGARVLQAGAPLLPQLTGSATYQRTTANFVQRPGALPTNLSSMTMPAIPCLAWTPLAPPGTGFACTQVSMGSTMTSTARDAGATYNFFSFGLTLSQQLFDFGNISRFQAARASAASQRHTEKATLLQVLLAVRQAYFSARAARALVGVARETLANQERHLRQIEGFVQVGTRPEIDLAQARVDVANARVQLINAENNYDVAKAQLNQAIGVEGPTDYDVSDEAPGALPGEVQSTEALLDEALRARPEFAALVQQLRAQQATARAAAGGFAPSLNASTSITAGGIDADTLGQGWNWNLGVSLTWQLLGFLPLGQLREARATLRFLEAQGTLLRQQVRLEVEQARLAVRAARATVEASTEAEKNARERLRLAEGRYQAGVGNIIELGDAQLALNSAAAQRVQSEYQLASARAQLLKALGRG